MLAWAPYSNEMKRNISALFIFVILVSAFGFRTAAKKVQLEPSYAWKLVPPLGLREPATIDTLFQNYSLEFIPQQVSPAYAATGNYCAEGYNMLFMERKPMSDFFFRDAPSLPNYR